MTDTDELTTGYVSWLRRQRWLTEARVLLAAMQEDLATGRLARPPRTVAQVEEWLLSRPVCPPSLAVALRVTADGWRRWLRSLVRDEPAQRGLAGRPTDNPFARSGTASGVVAAGVPSAPSTGTVDRGLTR